MSPPAWLNGQLMPESEIHFSIWDRSWMYGDGIFETIRVHHSHLFRWKDHWSRFSLGARALRLSIPHSEWEVTNGVETLLREAIVDSGIVRIHLSRGVGVRGYSTRGCGAAQLVITLRAVAPITSGGQSLDPLTLHTSSIQLPFRDPIGGFKHASRLPLIMAQQEAEEAGCRAALLADTQGNVAESTRGNMFWIEPSGTVATPPLCTGALDGVTRRVVQEICDDQGISRHEVRISPALLKEQVGIFVTGTGFGIEPVATIDAISIRPHTRIATLQTVYHQWVENNRS